ncbi:hypothetical protein KC315_g17 [Hortaea werneckii]|nr:hypothetical protein KC315_g17 [Hortaea werneckii]
MEQSRLMKVQTSVPFAAFCPLRYVAEASWLRRGHERMMKEKSRHVALRSVPTDLSSWDGGQEVQPSWTSRARCIQPLVLSSVVLQRCCTSLRISCSSSLLLWHRWDERRRSRLTGVLQANSEGLDSFSPMLHEVLFSFRCCQKQPNSLQLHLKAWSQAEQGAGRTLVNASLQNLAKLSHLTFRPRTYY